MGFPTQPNNHESWDKHCGLKGHQQFYKSSVATQARSPLDRRVYTGFPVTIEHDLEEGCCLRDEDAEIARCSFVVAVLPWAITAQDLASVSELVSQVDRLRDS